jgi:hypothetical protein
VVRAGGAGALLAWAAEEVATRAVTADLGSLPASQITPHTRMTKSRSVLSTREEEGAYIHPPFSPGPWLKLGLKGGL